MFLDSLWEPKPCTIYWMIPPKFKEKIQKENQKMGKVLVTGGAGFIGSSLCMELLKRGESVIALDNMNDSYNIRLKQFRLEKLKTFSNFEFILGDVSKDNARESFRNKKLDVVYHLAARAGIRQSTISTSDFIDSNVKGTLNALEIAKTSDCSKFVCASTSSIYGENPPLPTPESAESSFPLQPYAATKKAAEVLAYSYHHLHKMDVSVLRYFTVYGPMGRPDLAIPRFIHGIYNGYQLSIYGDGKQARGFTFIDDIVLGTIKASKSLGYEIINLGGKDVVSLLDLVRRIENILKRKAHINFYPANPADMYLNEADTKKAKELLEWTPTVDIQTGLEKTCEWHVSENHFLKNIFVFSS
jgi:UDP-glucuronate 4-epimerase